MDAGWHRAYLSLGSNIDAGMNLALAFAALRAGGAAPATLNAANEEAVEAFLAQRIGFLDIARVIEACLERSPDFAVDSLDAVFAADAQARDGARAEIRNLSAAR